MLFIMKIIIIHAPILSTSGNDKAQEWKKCWDILITYSLTQLKLEKEKNPLKCKLLRLPLRRFTF